MRENQNQEAKKRKRKKKSKSEFNTKVYLSVWANGLLDKSLPFDWMRCCCCLLSSLLLGRKPTVRYGHPDAANHLILIKKVVWLNGRVRGRRKKKKCPTPVIPILLRRIGVTSTVIIILVDFSSPGRREKDGRRRKKEKKHHEFFFYFFIFFITFLSSTFLKGDDGWSWGSLDGMQAIPVRVKPLNKWTGIKQGFSKVIIHDHERGEVRREGKGKN